MSSSHLLLGLPIALLVLYFELHSGFHSASLTNHLSLGDVVLSASLHSIFLWVLFQHLIFSFPIFSMASVVLLFYVVYLIFFFNLCSINLFVIVTLKWHVAVLVVVRDRALSVFASVISAARVFGVFSSLVLTFCCTVFFVSYFSLYDESEHFSLRRMYHSFVFFCGCHVPDA